MAQKIEIQQMFWTPLPELSKCGTADSVQVRMGNNKIA